jgi:hypothetical protein
VIFVHHARFGELPVDLLEELGILLVGGQIEGLVAHDHDRFEVLGAHDRPCPQAAEMAVCIHVDAGHGRPVLSRRSDPKNGPVAGATRHST